MRTQLTNVRANSIRPLLTATLALAITFTLSCSGGDDPNNGNGGGGGTPSVLNPSDLPTQVYHYEYSYNNGEFNKIRNEYTGSSKMEIYIPLYAGAGCVGQSCLCDGFDGVIFACEPNDPSLNKIIPAGEIKDGKVSLALPPQIEDKYLRDFNMKNGVSAPPNLRYLFVEGLRVAAPDKGNDCRLYLQSAGGAYEGSGDIHYFSKSGQIIGTSCFVDTWDGVCREYNDNDNYDLNISEGWNLVYSYEIQNDASYSHSHTSDFSKIGGELEWRIMCDL
jgi:hypothetical protein